MPKSHRGNPWHDERGRFTHGPKSKVGVEDTEPTKKNPASKVRYGVDLKPSEINPSDLNAGDMIYAVTDADAEVKGEHTTFFFRKRENGSFECFRQERIWAAGKFSLHSYDDADKSAKEVKQELQWFNTAKIQKK